MELKQKFVNKLIENGFLIGVIVGAGMVAVIMVVLILLASSDVITQ